MVLLLAALMSGGLGAVAQEASVGGASVTDPALTDEQADRAERLMTRFGCVVCAGQSVAESNAEPAVRMRAVIAQAVADDLSDHEIRDLVARRYGEAALLDPSARSGAGAALWLAPLVFVVVGAWVALRMVFRRSRQSSPSSR